MLSVANGRTMQLATVRHGRPWVATVYFVLFDRKFYWLSFPSRRHSEELTQDHHVAAAVVLKDTKPVIGIQLEGTATVVTDLNEIKPVLELYIEKYDQGQQFVDRFLEGKNQHEVYCFTPSKVMLFDELNLMGEPHQNITTNYWDL